MRARYVNGSIIRTGRHPVDVRNGTIIRAVLVDIHNGWVLIVVIAASSGRGVLVVLVDVVEWNTVRIRQELAGAVERPSDIAVVNVWSIRDGVCVVLVDIIEGDAVRSVFAGVVERHFNIVGPWNGTDRTILEYVHIQKKEKHTMISCAVWKHAPVGFGWVDQREW